MAKAGYYDPTIEAETYNSQFIPNLFTFAYLYQLLILPCFVLPQKQQT
jgi:hypothetical protein